MSKREAHFLRAVVQMFFRRRRRKIYEPELSIEEMEELVSEGIRYAAQYAEEGNVSGMEMALEEAIKYARKLKKELDPTEIDRIKLKGYELGGQLMQKRAEQLKREGKVRESQNANILAEEYKKQAELIRRFVGKDVERS